MSSLTEPQRKEIIRRYDRRVVQRDAPRAIARELELDFEVVKAIVDEHIKQTYNSRKTEVRYEITDQTRDGLRLVKVSSPAGTMDWYTDKTDAEIKKDIRKMTKRFEDAGAE